MTAGPPSEVPRDAPRGLVALFGGLAGALEHWRRMLVVPLACMSLAVVLVLLIHPVYQAQSTFIIDSENQLRSSSSGLAGLALQLGLPVTGGGQSPKFFADLATSREVLLTVAAAHYPVTDASTDTFATLTDIYHLQPLTTPQGVDRALRRLRRDVGTSVDLETGLVTLTVDAPSRRLSAAVADTLLAALNRFNLERRQLRSKALRLFLEARLSDARSDLERAEDSVRVFRERNRAFAQSPELQLTDQRLQRAVELRQSLFVSLSTSYEQARMEEYRDTPTLTVVDPPRPPYQKVKPKRTLTVLGAGVLGLIISVGAFLLQRSFGALSPSERVAWNAARDAANQVPIVRALRRK